MKNMRRNFLEDETFVTLREMLIETECSAGINSQGARIIRRADKTKTSDACAACAEQWRRLSFLAGSRKEKQKNRLKSVLA